MCTGSSFLVVGMVLSPISTYLLNEGMNGQGISSPRPVASLSHKLAPFAHSNHCSASHLGASLTDQVSKAGQKANLEEMVV